MDSVTRRDPADKAKIGVAKRKLVAHPETAQLMYELGLSTTDANGFFEGCCKFRKPGVKMAKRTGAGLGFYAHKFNASNILAPKKFARPTPNDPAMEKAATI